MQSRKPRAIGADPEQRAEARIATGIRPAVKRVARYGQAAKRVRSVAVGEIRRTSARREGVQVRKARAIGVDPEQRAMVRMAASIRRSVKGVSRQNQSRIRDSAVAVGGI